MKIRPIAEQDADDLLACWNESADLDPMTPELLTEKIWADPDFDPSCVLVAVVGGKIIGLAVGIARARTSQAPSGDSGAPPRGFIKLLAVRPGARRRGVASKLLHRVERRLAELGCRSVRLGESAPNYLNPGVDVRYTAALILAERLGYTRIGETYNLEADLANLDFNVAQDIGEFQERGVEIRRAAASDRPAVDAFLASRWEAWKPEVANCFANDPISLHLALRSGKVVAFSAYDGNNRGMGWFGPMGTAESERGLGIGGLLLKRCLSDLAMQGLEKAIIPWVGPVGFYSNAVGARIARVFYRFEKAVSAG